MSSAPAANQIRAHLAVYQREGLTKSQAEQRLVAAYGQQVLASPPKSGIGLAAWLAPAILLAAGAVAAALVARRWARTRGSGDAGAQLAIPPGERAVLERRLDAELERFE
jgi:cytochrome c-type biogenesis protein CcmH